MRPHRPRLLRKTGLTPDHLTVVGLVVGVGAAFAIGSGHLLLGLLLVILAALPDLLDGALAKASDAASQRGAFFDSTVDRVTDTVLLGGVAWYLASNESPHMAILAVRRHGRLLVVISYQRAKAESLGPRRQGRADGAGRAGGAAVHRSAVGTACSSRCCG